MVEKIAVFRGLYLGDLVAATPALRALRRGYPEAEISLIGLPWAAALAPHLAPDINRFIPYPGAPGLDGEGSDAALQHFVRERAICSSMQTRRSCSTARAPPTPP